MKGFYIAQQGHVAVPLAPIDVTGGKAAKRVKMAMYEHVSFIVSAGVSAAAPTAILVKECTAVTGGTATAIAFNYYACTTADGDVLGARQTASASGITPSANDDIFYVIELDASELDDGFPWVEVSFTNTSNSVIASIVAILSGSRYAADQSPTVLA